jgi:hypothetical protein
MLLACSIFFFVGPIELLLQILYILVGSGTSEMIGVKPNCVVFDHYQKKKAKLHHGGVGEAKEHAVGHTFAMFIYASNLIRFQS